MLMATKWSGNIAENSRWKMSSIVGAPQMIFPFWWHNSRNSRATTFTSFQWTEANIDRSLKKRKMEEEKSLLTTNPSDACQYHVEDKKYTNIISVNIQLPFSSVIPENWYSNGRKFSLLFPFLTLNSIVLLKWIRFWGLLKQFVKSHKFLIWLPFSLPST